MSEKEKVEKVKIPTFIKKLWKEASKATNPYISFDVSGEKLVILDREKFVENEMSSITNSKDYRSFVRSLNLYGFYKVQEYDQEYPKKDVYYNSKFNLNDPSLLQYIKRDQKSINKETVPVINSKLHYLLNENKNMKIMLIELEERINKLERQNQSLFEIIVTSFQEGITSKMTNAQRVSTESNINQFLESENTNGNAISVLKKNNNKKTREDPNNFFNDDLYF